jgi:hypothetical protein
VSGIDEEMSQANDIRAAVIDDLIFDPDVDASHITVENRDDARLTVMANDALTLTAPWRSESKRRRRTVTSPSPGPFATTPNGPERKH